MSYPLRKHYLNNMYILISLQSQAKEGVLGKDDDGRERRHTGGNASGGNTPQPGQGTPGATGNNLVRQNSQTSQNQQNAFNKSNKGCVQDHLNNPQGNTLEFLPNIVLIISYNNIQTFNSVVIIIYYISLYYIPQEHQKDDQVMQERWKEHPVMQTQRIVV